MSAPKVHVLAAFTSLERLFLEMPSRDQVMSQGESIALAAAMANIRTAVAELIEAAQDVKRTEDAYWNMPITRNPERYAKAHEDARARLYEALARIGGAA